MLRSDGLEAIGLARCNRTDGFFPNVTIKAGDIVILYRPRECHGLGTVISKEDGTWGSAEGRRGDDYTMVLEFPKRLRDSRAVIQNVVNPEGY